jgi:hypothetical protein
LFAVYAFLDTGPRGAQAFSSRAAGPVFGCLLLGLISRRAAARHPCSSDRAPPHEPASARAAYR